MRDANDEVFDIGKAKTLLTESGLISEKNWTGPKLKF